MCEALDMLVLVGAMTVYRSWHGALGEAVSLGLHCVKVTGIVRNDPSGARKLNGNLKSLNFYLRIKSVPF